MRWKDLLLYLDYDSMEFATDGGYSYIALVPNDQHVILIQAQHDDDWYRATYVQMSRFNDDDNPDVWIEEIIIQLEGLPEDPSNFPVDTFIGLDIPAQVYMRVPGQRAC